MAKKHFSNASRRKIGDAKKAWWAARKAEQAKKEQKPKKAYKPQARKHKGVVYYTAPDGTGMQADRFTFTQLGELVELLYNGYLGIPLEELRVEFDV